MEMKPFTSADWECWSGAECWPGDACGNREPLIGYTNEYLMIADANGISVFTNATVDGDGTEWHHEPFAAPWTPNRARLVAVCLTDLSPVMLEAFGFFKIDGGGK